VHALNCLWKLSRHITLEIAARSCSMQGSAPMMNEWQPALQAKVIYTTGETEEIDLDEIVRDKALSLITVQHGLW
jgi:hypothetical protein